MIWHKLLSAAQLRLYFFIAAQIAQVNPQLPTHSSSIPWVILAGTKKSSVIFYSRVNI